MANSGFQRERGLVVLKTGNTVTGSEPDRWGKYAWAEANCAPFDIVAWAFDMACVIAKSMTLNDAETAVRKKFCSTNTISKDNDCPWDNAQVGDWYRLDRSGPGVPGTPPQGTTMGKWDKCRWIPGENAERPPSKKPDAAALRIGLLTG